MNENKIAIYRIQYHYKQLEENSDITMNISLDEEFESIKTKKKVVALI